MLNIITFDKIAQFSPAIAEAAVAEAAVAEAAVAADALRWSQKQCSVVFFQPRTSVPSAPAAALMRDIGQRPPRRLPSLAGQRLVYDF